jgi:hypothetical protein
MNGIKKVLSILVCALLMPICIVGFATCLLLTKKASM